MATGMFDVEFSIVGLRCLKCNHTVQAPTELEANVFLLNHGDHGQPVYLAKITSPASMASDRIIELEMTKGSIQ